MMDLECKQWWLLFNINQGMKPSAHSKFEVCYLIAKGLLDCEDDTMKLSLTEKGKEALEDGRQEFNPLSVPTPKSERDKVINECRETIQKIHASKVFLKVAERALQNLMLKRKGV